MDDDTAQTMLASITDYVFRRNPGLSVAQAQSILQSTFAAQIVDARSNNQINSKVSSGVRNIFGI